MTATITVAQYQQAEVQLQIQAARRGLLVHAVVYGLVQAALIAINLVVVPGFIWFPLPLIGWGIGLAMHYLFGLRWVDRQIRRHQQLVEQRASRPVG